MKRAAQNALMHGIGNVLGYARPHDWDDWTTEQQDAYHSVLQREADRVAKLFGFESAWSN
jgi:hypothetical protein